jgi:EAL domain-containing protein (putative c-di-GMP-specific phosphodiesterase class I)
VARLTGGQFAILFLGSSERTIGDLCEAIRKTIALPINLDMQEIFLTACIGVSHNRESGLTAEQLLKEATIALYEAKRRGSGMIEVFSTSMRDDRAELVVREAELRRAIERNEIEVHFQPIARLADMNLAGFEALVRWRHPAMGLLAPESFIDLAEQTGTIKEIGRAVLIEAGRQLGIWQRSFRQTETLFVAVNISSAQLIEPTLIDDIAQLLHREALSSNSLKIEVTESLVMEHPELAVQVLQRLKELGVGLSCDDFGTGHSSLSSLRKLPFDTLKVDRSFIASDATDERSTAILEAIIAMAHAIGLVIVAEGIESQDQVDRLGALNCDLGQGYFIGRPMTAKQVTDALAGLPYTASSGRTAITWLWEKAAKDPAPTPLTVEMTAAAIEESRGKGTMEHVPVAVEKVASEAAVILAEPETEIAKTTVPPLGLAPKAPRTVKLPEENTTTAAPIAAENRSRRARKRRKRLPADEQAKRAAKKLPSAPH